MATTGADVSRRTSTVSPFGSTTRRTVDGSMVAGEAAGAVVIRGQSLENCQSPVSQHDQRRDGAGRTVRAEPAEQPRIEWRARSDRAVDVRGAAERRQNVQEVVENGRRRSPPVPQIAGQYGEEHQQQPVARE